MISDMHCSPPHVSTGVIVDGNLPLLFKTKVNFIGRVYITAFSCERCVDCLLMHYFHAIFRARKIICGSYSLLNMILVFLWLIGSCSTFTVHGACPPASGITIFNTKGNIAIHCDLMPSKFNRYLPDAYA